MKNKELIFKTEELANYFDGMATLDIILVLANFISALICYSVKDKANYDKAVDEFIGYVKAGLENAKKAMEKGGEQ